MIGVGMRDQSSRHWRGRVDPGISCSAVEAALGVLKHWHQMTLARRLLDVLCSVHHDVMVDIWSVTCSRKLLLEKHEFVSAFWSLLCSSKSFC